MECVEEENGKVSQRTNYSGCWTGHLSSWVGATAVEGPLRELCFYDLGKDLKTYFGHPGKKQTAAQNVWGGPRPKMMAE